MRFTVERDETPESYRLIYCIHDLSFTYTGKFVLVSTPTPTPTPTPSHLLVSLTSVDPDSPVDFGPVSLGTISVSRTTERGTVLRGPSRLRGLHRRTPPSTPWVRPTAEVTPSLSGGVTPRRPAPGIGSRCILGGPLRVRLGASSVVRRSQGRRRRLPRRGRPLLPLSFSRSHRRLGSPSRPLDSRHRFFCVLSRGTVTDSPLKDFS